MEVAEFKFVFKYLGSRCCPLLAREAQCFRDAVARVPNVFLVFKCQNDRSDFWF